MYVLAFIHSSAHLLIPAQVSLLRRGVSRFADETGPSPRMRNSSHKMPWKKISDWMVRHDSSYNFAPATCAKKWKEVK